MAAHNITTMKEPNKIEALTIKTMVIIIEAALQWLNALQIGADITKEKIKKLLKRK